MQLLRSISHLARRGFSSSSSNLKSLTKPGGRVVLLGSGWGNFSLLRTLDSKVHEVVVISPRNHFLFTPLLPSASVGTLEFRCITEPIRQNYPHVTFYQATCDDIDFDKKTLSLTAALEDKPFKYSLTYDSLVIAPGAVPNTFGIPGVQENAHFLKQLGDARKIRQRIIECFEFASEPSTSEEEIDSTLNFVVVGAGPTGIEFAGELYDFVTTDVVRLYPKLSSRVKVTVIEASNKILSTFDESLGTFAQKIFTRQGITVRSSSVVKEVKPGKVILQSGEEVPYGLLVWSTGVGATDLIKKLPLDKEANRILTTPQLQVLKGGKPLPGVFSIGDCATVKGEKHAATAQMAKQKGYYLGKVLNKITKGEDVSSLSPFSYHHLGAFAYIGGWKALYDSSIKISGFSAWVFWRSAYFSMTVSMRNKIIIPMYWFLSWAFGRDTTRF